MTSYESQKKAEGQCNEWLNPMKYYCGCVAGNCLIYTYNDPGPACPWPSIRCRFNESGNVEDVILVMGNRKTTIKAQIGPISFRHSDIKSFIAELRYLANCCDSMWVNHLAQWHIKNLMNEIE